MPKTKPNNKEREEEYSRKVFRLELSDYLLEHNISKRDLAIRKIMKAVDIYEKSAIQATEERVRGEVLEEVKIGLPIMSEYVGVTKEKVVRLTKLFKLISGLKKEVKQ